MKACSEVIGGGSTITTLYTVNKNGYEKGGRVNKCLTDSIMCRFGFQSSTK